METGGLRVAIVGAGGLVGGALTPGLSHHQLRLLDRRPSRRHRIHKVDARHLRSLTRALEGCEVVIDLACDARWSTPWADVYRNNIRITHTVLEASRRAGVRRVVHASSNQVASAYERDEPWAAVLAGRYDNLDPGEIPRLGPEAPPRPRTAYGAGKVFSEAACRWYSEEHGLSTVCLRIGTVLIPDRPRNERHYSTWLSHRDLVGFFEAAVTAAPSLAPTVAWAVSANTWRIWETGCGALGYHPRDDAESFR